MQWQCNLIKLAAKKGRIFGTDQVALALSIYEDKIPTQFLPAYCNWMCEFHLPLYDESTNKFLEPYLPNHEIGIVHFAGKNNDQIRNDKNFISKIKTLDGDVIEKKLRFLK